MPREIVSNAQLVIFSRRFAAILVIGIEGKALKSVTCCECVGHREIKFVIRVLKPDRKPWSLTIITRFSASVSDIGKMEGKHIYDIIYHSVKVKFRFCKWPIEWYSRLMFSIFLRFLPCLIFAFRSRLQLIFLLIISHKNHRLFASPIRPAIPTWTPVHCRKSIIRFMLSVSAFSVEIASPCITIGFLTPLL